jgi:broad specificity phosphatase PhoE
MVILFRHGEGYHNINKYFSCGLDSKAELTTKGIMDVNHSALELKLELKMNKQFKNLKIYSSPLLRTMQTSKIICKSLDINDENIVYDDRLKEVDMGEYNEKPVSNFPYDIYNIEYGREYGGEIENDVLKRMSSFINSVNYKKNNIIIVSHALPLLILSKYLGGSINKIKVSEYRIIR